MHRPDGDFAGSGACPRRELAPLEAEYAEEDVKAESYRARARDDRARASMTEDPDQKRSLNSSAEPEERQAEPHQQRMREIAARAEPIRRKMDAHQGAADSAAEENRHWTETAMSEYAALARDRQIFDALRTLNRGARPKVAMGPIEMYDRNVLALMAETLSQLGFARLVDCRRGDLYHLADDAKLMKGVSTAVALSREIAVLEARQVDARTAGGGGGPVAGPAAGRPAGPAAPPNARASLAAKKADLTAKVAALRLEAEELARRRDRLMADSEVRDAIEAINRVRRPGCRIAPKPGVLRCLQDLEVLGRSIPPASRRGTGKDPGADRTPAKRS